MQQGVVAGKCARLTVARECLEAAVGANAHGQVRRAEKVAGIVLAAGA